MMSARQAARVAAPEPAPPGTAHQDAKLHAAPRYAFLDGIRGVGALTVLLTHMLQPFGLENELPATWIIPPLLRQLVVWMYAGRYAVVVFIVLSGYCLMLPVARSPGLSLRGGLWDYFLRRSRRILPVYFTALLLSVAFYRLVWEAPVDVRSLGAHVLLIHHLFPAWVFDLNPVMWTVALEWQIYAFFPLLLLPTWRRWGWQAAVLVALAVGLAPVIFLPAGSDLMWTAPWFLGLFGFGMAAAAADPYRWPWGRISLGAIGLGLAVGVIGGIGRVVVDDLLVGAGTPV
jgi:peptidoglycan/LPS O-acetylase OafA/YrhL